MIQFIQVWWAHLGSNQGPTGYEPVALPLSYRPKLAYKIILKILAHVKIRIATKRYRSQASTGRVCPFGTGPKSFVSGTFPLLFNIYVSKKFSVFTGLRAQTRDKCSYAFFSVRNRLIMSSCTKAPLVASVVVLLLADFTPRALTQLWELVI